MSNSVTLLMVSNDFSVPISVLYVTAGIPTSERTLDLKGLKGQRRLTEGYPAP